MEFTVAMCSVEEEKGNVMCYKTKLNTICESQNILKCFIITKHLEQFSFRRQVCSLITKVDILDKSNTFF